MELVNAAAILASESNHDGMSGWGWAMMIVFAILFAGLLATAIWALVTYVNRTRAGQERASPKDLLAERYARGEITTEEYQERRGALGE